MTRNEVAQEMFNADFDKLSAWAQSSVIHAMHAEEKPPHSATLNDVNGKADLQRLAAQIQVLEDELWEERQASEELRLENAKLRHELNLPGDASS